MRTKVIWVVGCSLMLGGFAALSLSLAQVPPPAPPVPQAAPAAPAPAAGRDPAELTPLQQQMYWSAQRGADWLYRMNGRDGRFVHGQVIAMNAPLDGHHYLRQAGAAFALARAARLLGEERYAARAAQAVLLLLAETTVDPNEPDVRYPALPPTLVNRLGAAGLLVLAIHELPDPKDDLLKTSDQLCQYLRRQQRPDGSLNYSDSADDLKADPEGILHHPGAALYALMRSQQHRPAAWKTDVVRKALAYYGPWWRANKNPTFVAWQSAANAEAFLRTKEKPFAEFVFEMNDWLCGLQYDRLDPRQPFWYGGFLGWAHGKPVPEAPQIASAACAESLAEACRTARATGDLLRHPRYTEALERCLQFLTTLQYTSANTQHFAEWYQEKIVGGFHASHHDGNLRIDYNQHAVCALVQYLAQVR